SQASYVAQACTQALRQCGLTAHDVDGICGSTPGAPAAQKMLGIDEVTWFATPMIPFVNHLAAAASAVHSGLCDVVLAYHGAYRLPWNTSSAINDPLKATSACWLDDFDVASPCRGFTVITLNWFETAGVCGPGEPGDFIEQHWDEKSNRILTDGRIPVHPHGGALSEGATQGSGHL